MRALRISLVLFGLMAAVMIGSMVMNHYVCGHMRTVLEQLPPEPNGQAGEAVSELAAFWRHWRPWMRLTMNQTVWRVVNDPMEALAAYVMLGDDATPEYVGATRQLLCAVDEMSRPERLALKNLL